MYVYLQCTLYPRIRTFHNKSCLYISTKVRALLDEFLNTIASRNKYSASYHRTRKLFFSSATIIKKILTTPTCFFPKSLKNIRTFHFVKGTRNPIL